MEKIPIEFMQESMSAARLTLSNREKMSSHRGPSVIESCTPGIYMSNAIKQLPHPSLARSISRRLMAQEIARRKSC